MTFLYMHALKLIIRHFLWTKLSVSATRMNKNPSRVLKRFTENDIMLSKS